MPTTSATAGPLPDIDEKVLTRVRKLLAQAEHPTTSTEEAEAFSAKAAELMAKYVVDASLLDAAAPTHAVPVARRLDVLGPYVMPKVILLSAIGEVYGVRVIAGEEYSGARACTMIGFAADTEAVEVLFTSLLLQGWTAMNRASGQVSRPRAFRRAFLMGYAGTIGQRLREVRQGVVEEADQATSGGAAVVLASRAREVDDAVAREFPRLRSIRTTISDGGGLAAGRQAGEQANLSANNARVGSGRAAALG